MEKATYDWSYGRFNKTKYKNTIASSILGIIFTTNCLVVLDGPITRDQLQRSLSPPHIMLCSVGDYAQLDTRYPNSTLITNTCWLSSIILLYLKQRTYCVLQPIKKTTKKTDRQTTHYKGTQLSVASLCG